jgi:hypothetical protein
VTDLPLIDVHTTTVPAPPERAWACLEHVLPQGRGAEVVATLLGCEDTATAGGLAAGARVPGFRVAEARPPVQLRLVGRHRFSRYELRFDLRPAGGGGTEVTATSLAAFPGPHGRVYRALVIGSGGHVVAVRRMLRGVREAG